MQIENIRDINRGCISKSFNLIFKTDYGKMIIKGCLLMEKGSNQWVSLPSNKTERDGEVKYYPHVILEEKSDQQAFLAKALELVNVIPDKEEEHGLPF